MPMTHGGWELPTFAIAALAHRVGFELGAPNSKIFWVNQLVNLKFLDLNWATHASYASRIDLP